MIGFDFRWKTDGNLSGDGELSEGDQKRQKIISRFKTFRIQINFVSIIPFKTMPDGKHGVKSRNNEVLIALDTILQHSNAKRCILHTDPQKLFPAIKPLLTFFPSFGPRQEQPSAPPIVLPQRDEELHGLDWWYPWMPRFSFEFPICSRWIVFQPW